MVANSFLFTIGRVNPGGIGSITLPMPFEFRLANPHPALSAILPAARSRSVLRLAKQIPFNLPEVWTYKSSFHDVCTALERHCTNLRVLNLVLPAWYDPSHVDHNSKQKMFDRLAGLQNTILTAQERRYLVSFEICILKVRKVAPWTVQQHSSKQTVLLQEFRVRGWEDVKAACHKYGRY